MYIKISTWVCGLLLGGLILGQIEGASPSLLSAGLGVSVQTPVGGAETSVGTTEDNPGIDVQAETLPPGHPQIEVQSQRAEVPIVPVRYRHHHRQSDVIIYYGPRGYYRPYYYNYYYPYQSPYRGYDYYPYQDYYMYYYYNRGW